MSNWAVHKFGGTSLADAERFRRAAGILRSGHKPGASTAVVVSAMGGVTDALIKLVDLAASKADYAPDLQTLEQRHLNALDGLDLSGSQRQSLGEVFRNDFKNIEDVLRSVQITNLGSELVKEFVSGHGELWSAQLLDAHLQNCGLASSWLDARKVLVVEPDTRTITLDWQLSRQKFQSYQTEHDPERFLVITGYIASTHEGVATTLKRNG